MAMVLRHLASASHSQRRGREFEPWIFETPLLQFDSAERSNTPGRKFVAVYTDERDTTTAGFPLLKNRAFVLRINPCSWF